MGIVGCNNTASATHKLIYGNDLSAAHILEKEGENAESMTYMKYSWDLESSSCCPIGDDETLEEQCGYLEGNTPGGQNILGEGCSWDYTSHDPVTGHLVTEVVHVSDWIGDGDGVLDFDQSCILAEQSGRIEIDLKLKVEESSTTNCFLGFEADPDEGCVWECNTSDEPYKMLLKMEYIHMQQKYALEDLVPCGGNPAVIEEALSEIDLSYSNNKTSWRAWCTFLSNWLPTDCDGSHYAGCGCLLFNEKDNQNTGNTLALNHYLLDGDYDHEFKITYQTKTRRGGERSNTVTHIIKDGKKQNQESTGQAGVQTSFPSYSESEIKGIVYDNFTWEPCVANGRINYAAVISFKHPASKTEAKAKLELSNSADGSISSYESIAISSGNNSNAATVVGKLTVDGQEYEDFSLNHVQVNDTGCELELTTVFEARLNEMPQKVETFNDLDRYVIFVNDNCNIYDDIPLPSTCPFKEDNGVLYLVKACDGAEERVTSFTEFNADLIVIQDQITQYMQARESVLNAYDNLKSQCPALAHVLGYNTDPSNPNGIESFVDPLCILQQQNSGAVDHQSTYEAYMVAYDKDEDVETDKKTGNCWAQLNGLRTEWLQKLSQLQGSAQKLQNIMCGNIFELFSDSNVNYCSKQDDTFLNDLLSNSECVACNRYKELFKTMDCAIDKRVKADEASTNCEFNLSGTITTRYKIDKDALHEDLGEFYKGKCEFRSYPVLWSDGGENSCITREFTDNQDPNVNAKILKTNTALVYIDSTCEGENQ